MRCSWCRESIQRRFRNEGDKKRGTRRSRQSTVDSRREKTEQSSKPNRAHEMDAPSQNGNCWYTPWQFLRERQTNNLQDTSLGIICGRRTDNDLDGVQRSCGAGCKRGANHLE